MLSKLFPFLYGINDLTNTHYPYFLLFKRSLLTNHDLPSVNPLLFGGRPFFGDPLNNAIYPFNFIYLFLPFDIATILNIAFHAFILFFGLYLLLKNYFNQSKLITLLVSTIGVLWPKWSWHLQAGHLGLYESFVWLPFLILLLLKRKKPIIFGLILAMVYLASNYFFLHIIFFLVILGLGMLISNFKKQAIKNLSNFCFLAALVFFLCVCYQLIPQIKLSFQATRYNLLQADILPVWSFQNLFYYSIFPYANLIRIDQEQFIYCGIIFYVICFYGILKSLIQFKKIMIFMLLLFFLMTINFKTPFFHLIRVIPWINSLRVTSRFWILGFFILLLFFAEGLKRLPSKLAMFFCVLIIFEYAAMDSLKLISKNPFGDQKETKIYSFLQKNYFKKKIYTTGAFLSQYFCAIHELELVAGEHPWQTSVYINKLKNAGGFGDFTQYAVIYPPWQAEKEKAQPKAKLLCDLKAKAVLSKYFLKDKNFKYITEIDKIKLYENPCLKY